MPSAAEIKHVKIMSAIDRESSTLDHDEYREFLELLIDDLGARLDALDPDIRGEDENCDD